MAELQGIGTEGIGGDDITAGFKIVFLYFLNDIRMTEIPTLRVFAGRKSGLLQQGTHAAVQIKQVFLHVV